jgi:hypothetical protein
MNPIKKLSFCLVFFVGFIFTQSCQEPDISDSPRQGQHDTELKVLPIIPIPKPNPIFNLYALQNNTLYGIDHQTGEAAIIGQEGFWNGATALSLVHQGCGNPGGVYAMHVMKGNTLHIFNPASGVWLGGGSSPVFATTRMMFGYYLTRIVTESNLFFNLSCLYGPRNIAGSWSGIEATATVSHVNDPAAPRVETNYFVQNGSLYGLITTTATLIGSPGTWAGTEAMTSVGDQLYIVQNNGLYHVDTNTGTRTDISTGDWSGTEAMGSVNESLYVIRQGTLYRVDPSSGNSVQLGSKNWAGTVALVNLPAPRTFR